LKKVGSKFYERYQVVLLGNLDYPSRTSLVWKSTWSESVVLCRFDNVFVVMYHRLEFFLNGFSDFGGEQNV
jgi:hypothetical protein